MSPAFTLEAPGAPAGLADPLGIWSIAGDGRGARAPLRWRATVEQGSRTMAPVGARLAAARGVLDGAHADDTVALALETLGDAVFGPPANPRLARVVPAAYLGQRAQPWLDTLLAQAGAAPAAPGPSDPRPALTFLTLAARCAGEQAQIETARIGPLVGPAGVTLERMPAERAIAERGHAAEVALTVQGLGAAATTWRDPGSAELHLAVCRLVHTTVELWARAASVASAFVAALMATGYARAVPAPAVALLERVAWPLLVALLAAPGRDRR